MTINIGDLIHLKDYYENFWVGKITEMHKTIDDYVFHDPIFYVESIDKKIPRFDIVREYELELRNNEWWESNRTKVS